MAKEKFDNVELSVEDTIMTLKIDLSKEIGPSKSGKSILIATTHGNQYFAMGEYKQYQVNVNLYKPRTEE